MSKLLLGGAIGAGLLSYLAVKAKKGHAKRVFAPKTLGLTAPEHTEMVPVQSSMIKELGYRDKSGALVVKFNDGKTYRFKNVPRSLFTKIMHAGSKGEAFNKMVKNKYEHEKVGAKQNPFDRIAPPRTTKSLNDVLVDLRSLDTPEEWYAYVDKHHSRDEDARYSLEASRASVRSNGRK
jgi:DNA repair exonuclease SbcCD nuclease subunit